MSNWVLPTIRLCFTQFNWRKPFMLGFVFRCDRLQSSEGQLHVGLSGSEPQSVNHHLQRRGLLRLLHCDPLHHLHLQEKGQRCQFQTRPECPSVEKMVSIIKTAYPWSHLIFIDKTHWLCLTWSFYYFHLILLSIKSTVSWMGFASKKRVFQCISTS